MGGAGGDTFVFTPALVASSVATVADFTAGADTVELSLTPGLVLTNTDVTLV